MAEGALACLTDAGGVPREQKPDGWRSSEMYRPWTQAEDDELLALRTAGFKLQLIAMRLGRTEVSTADRGRELRKRAASGKVSHAVPTAPRAVQ
jgi:hypothetical protein